MKASSLVDKCPASMIIPIDRPELSGSRPKSHVRFFRSKHGQFQRLYATSLTRENCPAHTRLDAQPVHCSLLKELSLRTQGPLHKPESLAQVLHLEAFLSGANERGFSGSSAQITLLGNLKNIFLHSILSPSPLPPLSLQGPK